MNPLLRSKWDQINKREKDAVTAVKSSEQMNGTTETISIVKELVVSSHLCEEEPKMFDNVTKRLNEVFGR